MVYFLTINPLKKNLQTIAVRNNKIRSAFLSGNDLKRRPLKIDFSWIVCYIVELCNCKEKLRMEKVKAKKKNKKQKKHTFSSAFSILSLYIYILVYFFYI